MIDSNIKLEFDLYASTIDFQTKIYCSTHFYADESKQRSFYIQNQILSPQNQLTYLGFSINLFGLLVLLRATPEIKHGNWRFL